MQRNFVLYPVLHKNIQDNILVSKITTTFREVVMYTFLQCVSQEENFLGSNKSV
jgi:hypothetical protein